MKRAALGVLLISLVAGSTAFAGTFVPPAVRDNGPRNDPGHEQHRPDSRGDDRGSHDNRTRQGNNWNHRDDHRDDQRSGDNRSGDNRGWDNDRRWNEGRHYDGRSDNRRWASPPPRYVSPSQGRASKGSPLRLLLAGPVITKTGYRSRRAQRP